MNGRPSIQLSCYPGKGTSYGKSCRPATLSHVYHGITLLVVLSIHGIEGCAGACLGMLKIEASCNALQQGMRMLQERLLIAH